MQPTRLIAKLLEAADKPAKNPANHRHFRDTERRQPAGALATQNLSWEPFVLFAASSLEMISRCFTNDSELARSLLWHGAPEFVWESCSGELTYRVDWWREVGVMFPGESACSLGAGEGLLDGSGILSYLWARVTRAVQVGNVFTLLTLMTLPPTFSAFAPSS